MKDKVIPNCFYLIVYDKFRENYPHKHIKLTDAKNLLRAWNIPNEFKQIVLKELEMLGLIKINGTRKNAEIELIDLRNNLLNNKSKLFAMVGLWH